jgi:hypothetical protein
MLSFDLLAEAANERAAAGKSVLRQLDELVEASTSSEYDSQIQHFLPPLPRRHQQTSEEKADVLSCAPFSSPAAIASSHQLPLSVVYRDIQRKEVPASSSIRSGGGDHPSLSSSQ